MHHIVKVSSKGQIVLPAAVRRRLGLNAGARLELIDERGALRLEVVRPIGAVSVRELAGMVTAPSNGRPRHLAQFNPASLLERRRR